jgi:4-alpha-glucanotransferase
MDLPLDKPLAGILAPLFAIRTETDLGIGDTEGLRQLVEWSAKVGFRLIQLLPINETGNDNSPYNAIHSVAIDPGTIAISPKAIPDLSKAEFDAIVAEVDMEKLRAGAVDYRVMKPLKRKLLWTAFENFSARTTKQQGARGKRFREFKKTETPWLESYALYRVLMDENGTECWTMWPEHHRTPAAAQAWIAALKPPRGSSSSRRWSSSDTCSGSPSSSGGTFATSRTSKASRSWAMSRSA